MYPICDFKNLSTQTKIVFLRKYTGYYMVSSIVQYALACVHGCVAQVAPTLYIVIHSSSLHEVESVQMYFSLVSCVCQEVAEYPMPIAMMFLDDFIHFTRFPHPLFISQINYHSSSRKMKIIRLIVLF